MNGHFSYTYIFIIEKVVLKFIFRYSDFLRMFEWVVISFSLSSVGATYQRVMNLIFHIMINHNVKVYIDDIMLKSKFRSIHMNELQWII